MHHRTCVGGDSRNDLHPPSPLAHRTPCGAAPGPGCTPRSTDRPPGCGSTCCCLVRSSETALRWGTIVGSRRRHFEAPEGPLGTAVHRLSTGAAVQDQGPVKKCPSAIHQKLTAWCPPTGVSSPTVGIVPGQLPSSDWAVDWNGPGKIQVDLNAAPATQRSRGRPKQGAALRSRKSPRRRQGRPRATAEPRPRRHCR